MFYRNNPNDLLFAAAAGFALGALAMFILDPQQGRRRRALTRDKLAHARHEIGDFVSGTSQDLRNRAHRLAAEARGVVRGKMDSEELQNQPGNAKPL